MCHRDKPRENDVANSLGEEHLGGFTFASRLKDKHHRLQARECGQRGGYNGGRPSAEVTSQAVVRERGMLLILEDDAERIERFGTVLRRIAPGLEGRLWRNAWRMIEEMGPFLSFALALTAISVVPHTTVE